MNSIKKRFLTIMLLCWLVPTSPAIATDDDYSQAAGHTGVYVNLPNVWSLKCKIITHDLSSKNNKLGWYTAWPMIVDYQSKKFVQIGYITSPREKINKPTFFVAWSGDGEQINIKYLPDKKNQGNALYPGTEHEYALSLNIDGSVNIQIDGVKYLEGFDEKIRIGITEGTGEFFSEGSNTDIDISTKFIDCFYKIRDQDEWVPLEKDKKVLLYYAANGTGIYPAGSGSFTVKGKIKEVNKGRFFKGIIIKKRTIPLKFPVPKKD